MSNSPFTTSAGWTASRPVVGVAQRFAPLSREVVKVIVTHHPLDLPAGHTERDLVGRSRMAIESLAACGADLFLSGHLHISHTGLTVERFRIAGHSALVVHAGSAVSTRGWGEANAFNLIRIARPAMSVQRFEWHSEKKEFLGCALEQFQRTEIGWWPATTGSAAQD